MLVVKVNWLLVGSLKKYIGKNPFRDYGFPHKPMVPSTQALNSSNQARTTTSFMHPQFVVLKLIG